MSRQVQPDLFAAAPKPIEAGPNMARIRARLDKMMSAVREAGPGELDAATLALYRTVLPQMSNWLPDQEATRVRADFAAEIARLGG